MKHEAPCKGCTKRELGCHSTCPDYISFKKLCKETNEKKKEDDVFREYKSESRTRYIKWKKNTNR